MVLEIIIIKFSCILKVMSRNTFPEPQPDSASYTKKKYMWSWSRICSRTLLSINRSVIEKRYQFTYIKVPDHDSKTP